MKILIISESINVEDSSASKVNVALINNLKKCGYLLKVLHYSNKKIDLPEIETVLITERKSSIWFWLTRFQRYLIKIFNVNINKKVEEFFGFSFSHTSDSNSIAAFVKKHKFECDLIITLSKGASFRSHRALLKLPEYYQKWIAYIHDPYPFHYYPRPYNWVEDAYQKKEDFFRKVTEQAKYVAFPSKLLQEWMESYFPAIENKSLIIPHQINENHIIEAKLPDFFNKNSFSILHAGNLLKQRNPVFLINGFLNFLNNNPQAVSNSQLILIGNNDYHQNTLSKFDNHQNIIIKAHTNYDTVQLLEKNCSVNLILEAKSEISPFLPGKFPNQVTANKPIVILGPYYSEVKRLLGKDYPFWAEVDDVYSIEKIITDLYHKWLNEKETLTLNRKDLVEYCNEVYLKKEIDKIF